MLRRVVTHPYSFAAAAASTAISHRFISTEHKDITFPGQQPPQPPAVPHNEPIMPMDFNPHIEWFEYPKEIFDPKYPYTREEGIRMTEEAWESTMDEMASRYGMRLNMSSKPTFWLAWSVMFFYSWYTLWGCYRAMGTEPGWPHFRNIVLSQPNVPTLEDDDIFLDQWIRPEIREKHAKYDRFWNWKPLVNREGANTTWKIPMQYMDESEWRHMTSQH